MSTFSLAAQKADATGVPIVEGFAVQCANPADAPTVSASTKQTLGQRLSRYEWQIEEMPTDWLVCRPAAEALSKHGFPPLGEAWETVRELKSLSGVANAEPLLLTRLPVTNGSDAQQRFPLWGEINANRLGQIRAASDAAHKHWSLLQMGICDEEGQNGAWALWRARPENEDQEPGHGVLVAHPDTGYTPHAHLLPCLSPHAEDPTRFGKNFVERDQPDGLDPMRSRSLGHFPGHGTGTAGVIATGHAEHDQPWGVAPGAKILPLRVSSSVIHLSYQNLCDALVEAIHCQVHVISLSLGGPFGSELLNSLIRLALERGIIVVAAAGNYAPTVVFPARIPGVLACAASNALSAPWRFSGMGAEVAITAPGELVWHDWARTDANGDRVDDQTNGSGTSFAAANIAGLAALWLSYHGRDKLIANYNNQAALLPAAFRLCLQWSSYRDPLFLRHGKAGFGPGIARADALLLQKLPPREKVEAEQASILHRTTNGTVQFPVNSWGTILTLPTLTADGPIFADGVQLVQRAKSLERFLTGANGLTPGVAVNDQARGKTLPETEHAQDANDATHAVNVNNTNINNIHVNNTNAGKDVIDANDQAEIAAVAGMDSLLHHALARGAQEDRHGSSPAAVRRYLLRKEALLSPTLRRKLQAASEAAQSIWRMKHPELDLERAYKLPSSAEEEQKISYSISPPAMRRLRAFAFDPSLATSSADAAINEITIPVMFERGLEPGPVGDYLEVVDVDPASDCAYAPVDLNHPFLLAQDGLPRSESNPQFHQQMVYAVAMKTISHFEEALGRPIFWSSLRPWDWRNGERNHAAVRYEMDGTGQVVMVNGHPVKDDSDQFVRQLRLYPHALRAQNAYYSPQKRAILFGYFPAGDADPGAEYPGGVVFTCLAHDIIAHEMTHAIVDGMHVRYTEPTNPDVFAFHEAFADIVALFQRFTYPELLRDQIARARGRLDSGTLMTRLALQFGQATGRHQALRDALGYVVRQARNRDETKWRDLSEGHGQDGGGPGVTLADAARDRRDEQERAIWKRFQADPALLARVEEPHERGSFLVAAVFDAYLRIYEDRIADLKRIATGGTGVLPDGELHPDLVDRMANEASKSARHVLRMCIRAMDYVPPTDITFGEFLRALITADSDLVPNDDRRYRVAFIEAFRKWGIYPRDVRTLSEESLRWSAPASESNRLFPTFNALSEAEQQTKLDTMNKVRRALLDWQPGKEREGIFNKMQEAQKMLHDSIQEFFKGDQTEDRIRFKEELLGGIDPTRSFQVMNLRPARRIGPRGEFLTEMVVEILQSKNALPSDPKLHQLEKTRRRNAKEERANRGEEEEPDPIPFRGGVTLIVSMDDYRVRYAIYKRLGSTSREVRQRDFLLRAVGDGDPDAAEYSSEGLPTGWYTRQTLHAKWFKGRTSDREDMRASSCGCRRKEIEGDDKKRAIAAANRAGIPVPNTLSEPFALLHRN